MPAPCVNRARRSVPYSRGIVAPRRECRREDDRQSFERAALFEIRRRAPASAPANVEWRATHSGPDNDSATAARIRGHQSNLRGKIDWGRVSAAKLFSWEILNRSATGAWLLTR